MYSRYFKALNNIEQQYWCNDMHCFFAFVNDMLTQHYINVLMSFIISRQYKRWKHHTIFVRYVLMIHSRSSRRPRINITCLCKCMNCVFAFVHETLMLNDMHLIMSRVIRVNTKLKTDQHKLNMCHLLLSVNQNAEQHNIHWIT